MMSNDWCQRRASGNAQPQGWQLRHVRKLVEMLKKDRHAGKNRRPSPGESLDDCAWQAVFAGHQRHALADEWQQKIAESVTVRHRNDAIVQIIRSDSHGCADIVAIRNQLIRAKPDRS